MNKKKTSGVILLVIGVIGLIATYSMRPPSGFGEALMMFGQGKEFYIQDPFYGILMALFALLAVFGFVKIMQANNNQENPPKP